MAAPIKHTFEALKNKTNLLRSVAIIAILRGYQNLREEFKAYKAKSSIFSKNF